MPAPESEAEEAIRDAKKARDEIAAEINTERAHGASDADGADLALILESTSSQRFAFRLQAVSYTTPSGDAVFDGLTLAYHDAVLADARLKSLVKGGVSGRAGGGFVPAGGLIALRADGNRSSDDRYEQSGTRSPAGRDGAGRYGCCV